jgi:hypothetical protein
MIVVLCRHNFTDTYIKAILRQIPPLIRIKETEDPLQVFMNASNDEFGILYGESKTQDNHEVLFKAFHEKNSPFSISFAELKLFFEDLIKPRSPSLELIVSSELEDLV